MRAAECFGLRSHALLVTDGSAFSSFAHNKPVPESVPLQGTKHSEAHLQLCCAVRKSTAFIGVTMHCNDYDRDEPGGATLRRRL